MQVVSTLALALGGLVVVAMGVRLFVLSFRTGGVQERALGVGILLLGVLGGPLAAVSRSDGMRGTPEGDAWFALALCLVAAGMASMTAFPWLTFRRHSFGALIVVLLASVSLGAIGHGLATSLARGGAWPDQFAAMRPWIMAFVSHLILAFGWTGIESAALARRIRRQLALGLGERETHDRVRLWSIGSLTVVVQTCVVLLTLGRGSFPLEDATCRAVLSLCVPLIATAFGLATFPPAAYLARLRAERPATERV